MVEQPGVDAVTEVDVVKEAAVKASLNVPSRSKGRAKSQAKKSPTLASIIHSESFDNLPDYLRDNE
jgi:effector-binding domain-containing protein